jgi:uncharacterized protein YdhG (YjbR/CyaY superfamily)
MNATNHVMEKATRTVPAANVDEYLRALPEKVCATLEKLRKTIKAAAPKAEELISYQVPTFKYHGFLVCFAAFKNHCSLYTTSHSVMKVFRDELKSYDTSGVTIHFTAEKPLPASLVKKLVKARIRENEERLIAKKNKK